MDAATFDIPAYFHRIGYAGARWPTLQTLTRIIACHAQAIPFENIDGLMRRVPSLEMAKLQDKLVLRRRGGYCYEQNSLFLACLQHLGFTVQALEARVRAGAAPGGTTARTHMALKVSFDEIDYLVDVGFGGMAPLAPLVLHEPAAQSAPGSVYRLMESKDELLLQIQSSEGWNDCYSIINRELHPADRVVGNWFASTHPEFMLMRNVLMSRLNGDTRLTLWNNQLTHRTLSTGDVIESQVSGRSELADLLSDGFNLDLQAEEIDTIFAIMNGRIEST